MLVSILIPAFNAQRWLAATIESALAQTWPAIEVIVVDDGSRDRTAEIARGFEARGVCLIRQRNAGAAAARNAALRSARGKYLQFLDADDLLHPDKIARQMQAALALADTRVLLTGRWARFHLDPARAHFAPDALWQELAPVDWIAAKFTGNCFMVPAAWLVSRELVRDAGPWDERLSLDDDGEYLCRLVAASRRVCFVETSTCWYRIGNPASLSSRTSDAALRSLALSLQACVAHLLALQDSPWTRQACLTLLQDNVQHFHPQSREALQAFHALAHRLGGSLQPPRERLHFRLFRMVFGWRAARWVRAQLNHMKARLRRGREALGRAPAAAR